MPLERRPETRIIGQERVERIAHEGSATIQNLLRHFRSRGLTCVPVPLRLDPPVEELTYLPGICYSPTEARPSEAWSDDRLYRLGRTLRAVHDASMSFLADHPESTWFPYAEPCLAAEVVCHNDLGPWNVPVADEDISIIDWEMAAPGEAIWDVAHVAWNWIPYFPPGERAHMGVPNPWRAEERLALLLEAYGGNRWDSATILREIVRRQTRVLELSAMARTSQAMLLQNWAKVDPSPILADRRFVEDLIEGRA